MRTLDLVARHKSEYAAARSPRLVTAGPGRYLALAGCGDPEGEAFRRQAAAIVALGRAVRAATRARGKDFRLPPLELLRWREAPPRGPGNGASNGDPAPGTEPAGEEWWKLLLRVPNFVKANDLATALAALADGPEGEARAVRVESLKEGRCVQAVHVGSASTEAETVERMRRAAADLGLAFHGRRHEIRLTRSGRASPERRRTVLRQPVRAVR